MNINRIAKIVLVGVIASTVVFANAASADHGFGSRLRVRDNNTQDYELVSLTPAGTIACQQGAEQLERSEISVRIANNDIHCHDYFANTLSWVGETYCTSVVWWNQRCDHFQIDFNLTGFDTSPDSSLEINIWKAVGCHEFGHTGGLAHVDLDVWSCMSSTVYNPVTFNQDDLDDIDADL